VSGQLRQSHLCWQFHTAEAGTHGQQRELWQTNCADPTQELSRRLGSGHSIAGFASILWTRRPNQPISVVWDGPRWPKRTKRARLQLSFLLTLLRNRVFTPPALPTQTPQVPCTYWIQQDENPRLPSLFSETGDDIAVYQGQADRMASFDEHDCFARLDWDRNGEEKDFA
jgi:hypothetical protein